MRKYYFQLVLSAGIPMNKSFPTAESAEFNLGIKRFVNAKKKSYFCLILKHRFMSIDAIKQELLSKLKQEHCFWSYNENSIKDIPDDMLIEKTLLHLDLEEINQLFQIYPFKKIKQVWLDYLVPQAEYLYTLNRFFAWYYFKVKKPDTYIKSMATRHLNKMLA